MVNQSLNIVKSLLRHHNALCGTIFFLNLEAGGENVIVFAGDTPFQSRRLRGERSLWRILPDVTETREG